MITPLQIRHLKLADLPPAGALVGRALLNSPTLLKMFPNNSAKRAGALGEVFAVMLGQTVGRGVVFGAFRGENLVGTCAISEPGRGGPSATEKLAIGKTVSRYTSFGSARTFRKWQSELARRHPDHRHWLLGPVAVEPNLQHQGIGSALMQSATEVLSANREPAFFATDMNESVPFFERFGFKNLLQAAIHGVTHKFLLRPPG